MAARHALSIWYCARPTGFILREAFQAEQRARDAKNAKAAEEFGKKQAAKRKDNALKKAERQKADAAKRREAS